MRELGPPLDLEKAQRDLTNAYGKEERRPSQALLTGAQGKDKRQRAQMNTRETPFKHKQFFFLL